MGLPASGGAAAPPTAGRPTPRDARTLHRRATSPRDRTGFATLDAAGGFGLPADLDASFDRLVERFVED